MVELSDTVERKYIESIDVDDWLVMTDSGWQPISAIHQTIEYQEYDIHTENYFLRCADTHILFNENLDQIFAKDLVPGKTYISTETGFELVQSVELTGTSSNMFDLTVDSEDHRYYTGGILSHNSVSCTDTIFYALFGRPYRDIKKPQLINTITGKNLLVELEFSVLGVDYMVRRGMRPGIFEVYRNGELLNQEGDSRDYQEVLEKTILRLRYKTARQIAILGSASFVPFILLLS